MTKLFSIIRAVYGLGWYFMEESLFEDSTRVRKREKGRRSNADCI